MWTFQNGLDCSEWQITELQTHYNEIESYVTDLLSKRKGGLSSWWENHKAVTPAPSNMTSYWLPGTYQSTASTVALVTVASPNTFPSTNICTKCQKQAHKYCCWRGRWPLQEASTTRIHRMIDEDQDISRRAGCNLWLKKRWFWRWRKNKTKQQLISKHMRADELGNWQKLENWGTSCMCDREDWQHLSSIYVKPTPNPP